MIFRRSHQSNLEAKLRRNRPLPDDELVHGIVSHIEADRPAVRTGGLRIGFVAATLGAATALAVFGGVTYAASSVEHAAVAVKHVFVAKKPARAAKPAPSADVLNALQPGKTSAADQYLPPGITPLQALTSFSQYVIKANQDLQAALNCGARRPIIRGACTRRVNALKQLEAQNRTALNAAIAKVGALPANVQARIGTLLAIQLQQQQKLAAGQVTRRSNCASAAYRAAHRLVCAKANPLFEAAERLKLGELELAELNAFLTSV
jgi:hypothetical protein